MLTGIITNNATMIADAKRWITGYIRAAINHIGVDPGIRRWQDGPCAPTCGIGSAWGHSGGMMGSIIQAVDVLARTGDTSLYTYSAPTELPGSPGGTVSLFVYLRKWARMAMHTEPVYTYSGGSPNTEITWNADPWPGGRYEDFPAMAANLFYKNSEISTAMNRNTKSGTNSPFAEAGCDDSQFGSCFSGANAGWWPDLPFMYGNMEGKVNPYGGSTGPSVSLSAAPATITPGQSSTLSWSSSNVTSCSASGGWSGSKATSGSQTVTPTVTTTYTLTCTGTGGSATQSTTVTVGTSTTWTFCANEGQTCTFSGTQQVRYGANDTYFYGTFTNSVSCGNSVFGDPLFGVVKHCDVATSQGNPSPSPPSNLHVISAP
jgi:hypothetical protein